MKITIAAGAPAKSEAVTLRFTTTEATAELRPGIPEAEFSGRPGSLLHLRHENALLVGLGEQGKVDATRLRCAAGAAGMFLKKIGRTAATAALHEWPQFAGAAIEGLILGGYRFDRFKTKKARPWESLHVEAPAKTLPAVRRTVARGRIVAEAANLSRDVGNLPGNVLYPKELATIAVRIARQHGLKATVLDERALTTKGFGGLTAVGGGSVHPPRLIVLEHRGGKPGERPLALVGKAVTFDSGGISIKPAANMEELIFDKCGGTAVLGAMAAIAELGVKRNIVGVIPSAENLLGGAAYRPGDIVKTYDGTHIEITNTDAEGRVILADALAYARLDLKAAAMINLATLTGACGIALGEHAAGFWSNDEAFAGRVKAAADRAGERIWPMPLYSEYEDQIKSDVAQIKNASGRMGGACTAAAFLKAFVGETPWAHLDIAFMANREKDQAHLARGATGFGVRTLVELAEAW